MHILMIEPIGYGGIRYYTEQLIRHLLLEDTEISLVTARNYERLLATSPYPIYTVIGGCDREKSRLQRGIDYTVNHLKVAGIIHRLKPDLVHFQDTLVSGIDLLLMLWLKKCKTPIIYTVHDIDRSAMKYRNTLRVGLNRAVYRIIYHQANRLIVHTKTDMQRLNRDFGVIQDNIFLIEPGNHTLQLQHIKIPTKEESRATLGIPLNVPVGLFFGEHRYSKGLDILLNAMPQILAEIPEFRLIVAGRPMTEYRKEFRSLIQKVNFRNSLIIDNRYIPAEEVPKYFIASDMVILPYRSVSQSSVVHLAFSLGRPVIASRVGGLAEVVEEGVTGIFINNVANHEEVATKIIYASRRLDWLNLLGHNARYQAEKRFGWTKIAQNTKEVYIDALTKV